jgi:phosphate starvation-inducible membrane PsiE
LRKIFSDLDDVVRMRGMNEMNQAHQKRRRAHTSQLHHQLNLLFLPPRLPLAAPPTSLALANNLQFTKTYLNPFKFHDSILFYFLYISDLFPFGWFIFLSLLRNSFHFPSF